MIKTEKSKRSAGCRYCKKIIPKETERFRDLFNNYSYFYHLNCYLKHLKKEVEERNEIIKFINLKFKKQLKQEIKRRFAEEL